MRFIGVEIALVCKELWARKRLLLVGVVVSAFLAWLSIYRIDSVFPPKYESRHVVYSGAYTQALVDSPSSFLGDYYQQVGPLVVRSTVYANLMASPAVIELIGKYAGIPSDRIWAAGPVDPSLQRAVIEPTADKRNLQVAGEPDPYRLEFLADPNLPTVGIYSQAPTTAQAVSLANASVRALADYVQEVQDQQKLAASDRVSIRQIGQAAGAVVDGGVTKKLAGLVFFLCFLAWCILVMIGTRARAALRRAELPICGPPSGAPRRRRASLQGGARTEGSEKHSIAPQITRPDSSSEKHSIAREPARR